MKFSKYLVYGLVSVAALSASSCIDDLNVTPNDPNTKTEPTSRADIEGLFANVYYDLLTGDGLSVSDGGAGSFMRCHFNLNEIVADEVFISKKWNDPGYDVLNFNTWGNDSEWVYAAFSRENHLAKIASDFIKTLKEYGPKFGYTEEEMKQMDAEARTLRAYAYYQNIDLFGRGPWIDENSITGQIPPTYDRKQLFDATVADLKAHVDNLRPASQQMYGRLSREAGYMLLAKLYLNAQVYTGTAMWQECADALKNVVNSGIELAPEYKYLFCASNDKYVGNGEIIWGVPQEIGVFETWGGTTYLTAGAFIQSADPEILGRLNFHGDPWSGLRVRPELSKALKNDGRRLLYEGSYQEEIPNLAAYDANSCGYMLIKYTNTTEKDYYNDSIMSLPKDQRVFNNASQLSNADYPLFRLADAYLMLAECELHGVKCDGFVYFNKVRARAGMKAIDSPTASEILKERQAELYCEGHRRSDLVRFGLYTGAKYLWSWKGGEFTGATISDHRAVFPVPYQYVGTVGQNPGY